MLLVLAAVAAGVVAQGAYYPPGQRLVAALLTAAFGSAIREGRIRLRDFQCGPVLAAGGLALAAVVSGVAAGDVSGATGWALLMAALVGAFLVARGADGDERDLLLGGLTAIGVMTAVAGWIGVAWRFDPWALESAGLWRAATTLSYSNAGAGLLGPLALLALARTAKIPASQTWSVAAFLLLVGLGATLSRGGGLAFAVGVLVLAVLLGAGPVARATAAPALGALVALAGLAPSFPAAAEPRPVWAVAALGVGLAVAWFGSVRRAVLIPIAVAAAIGVAVVASSTSTTDLSRGRLSAESPERMHEFRAAVRLAAERPVFGVGPGHAVLVWVADDGRAMTASYVHNEYLQTLTELGTVGLALVGALVAAIAMAAWRSRAGPLARPLWDGAVAALAALAVHAGVDFLFHIPVIAVVAALLAGAATHQPSRRQ